MKWTLAAVLSLAILFPNSAHAQQIIIDGNIPDWAGVAPLIVDPAGDGPFNSAGQYFPGEDFRSVAVVNDSDHLYLLLEFAANHTGGILLFLDTDRNAGTGCNGSEFVVFVTGSEPGGHLALGDFRACSVRNDFPGAIRSLPPHNVGRFLEASIPLSILRTITPNMSALRLSGRAIAPPPSGVNDNIGPAVYSLTLPPRMTPVVVIPGLMGTALHSQTEGWLWVDPIKALSEEDDFLNGLALDDDGRSADGIQVGALFTALPDFYGGLLQSLRDEGYTDGTTLFAFPYDWRLDNSRNADLLATYIENTVLPASAVNKVDIVAHSMGGLIARSYGARSGTSRLNKLIYLGTPHAGSPKSFATLAFDYSLTTSFVDFPLLNSATVAGLASTLPSVFQLLPTEPFILSRATSEWLSLDESYKTSGLLRSSRWVDSAYSFQGSLGGAISGQEFNIVGSGLPTLSQLDLMNEPSVTPRSWRAKLTNGDATVTVGSATEQPAQNVYFNGVRHQDLPNDRDVNFVVRSILRGDGIANLPATASLTPSDLPPTYSWHTGSPIRIVVRDQNGFESGVAADGSLLENIPGSSFFTFEGHEAGFLPATQKYEFTAIGTQTGVFDFTVEESSSEGNQVQQTTFVDVPIMEGSVAQTTVDPVNGVAALAVDVDADGNADVEVPAGEATPADLSLDILRRILIHQDMNAGIRRSLLAKIDAASSSLARGNTRAAANQLEAIRNQLNAQTNHVPSQLAANISTIVTSILAQLTP